MDMHASGPSSLHNARPRATRFAMALPLRIRVAPESVWHAGWIENISSSGILFACHATLERGDTIELTFSLTAENIQYASGIVVCEAQIVRTEARASPEGSRAFAAAISRYQLVPAETAATSSHREQYATTGSLGATERRSSRPWRRRG